MISDFDPLKMLEDLQTGFLALEQNQRTLLDNQLKIQEQLKLIIGVQQSLQGRQDVIKQVLDLVIQAQKHTV
ncbi:hypothetical protein UFOVP640_4 [uncultured Caudovirales phage]|uniref:Uncharacterized protein n=1 Tax=uncultured Caudovirales phage TaxID=2100421 RepID=A0A6J5N378_9CAUD|nr:hypothetical protein UFOVP640_4 [uncultured Caudovirales phage]CAB5225879.1 hypothetical protein UFOVP759_8 [uncultured Caudovirales phage]